MNMPVASTPSQLPAHLQDFAGLASFGQDAIGGISVGKAHPRISIKQNRFRLINEQGQEYVVPQLHLDVIVVGVNKFVSKIYYAQAFNPGDPEPPAPTCFSDNGIAPSVRATTPQCGTCAACPHNVWGSKVTPTGSKIKSCADSKKFAVVLADNPTGLVYELRVPAASMENIKNLVDMLNERKQPLPGFVIRLSFDEQSQFPKLIFTPVNYITEQQKAAVLEVLDGEEASKCVGKDDKPIAQFNSSVQGLPKPPLDIVVPPVPVPPSAFVPQGAPAPQAPQFTPAAPPQAAAPVMPVFTPPAPAAVPPAPVFNPMGGAPAPEPVAPAPKRRRSKAVAEVPQVVAAPAQPAFVPAPPPGMPAAAAPHPVDPGFQAAMPVQAPVPNAALDIPAFLRRDTPGAVPPSAAVPMQPQTTDQALDNIIGDAMR